MRSSGRLVLPGPFRAVRRRDVWRVQRAVGARLPADYLAFMTTANGSDLPYDVLVPPGADDAEVLRFSSLFTLTPDLGGRLGWGTVVGEHRAARDAPYRSALGHRSLPVAGDASGSVLFLLLDPDRYGEVWAVVHGLPDWARPAHVPTGDRLGPVAPSWSAYLDLLFVDDDPGEL